MSRTLTAVNILTLFPVHRPDIIFLISFNSVLQLWNLSLSKIREQIYQGLSFYFLCKKLKYKRVSILLLKYNIEV